jgi:hypothetical protein
MIYSAVLHDSTIVPEPFTSRAQDCTTIELGSNIGVTLFEFHPDIAPFIPNNISEKIVLAINKYKPKHTSTVRTVRKYFFVSALVGHTTCFNSLTESLKNCIIQIINKSNKKMLHFIVL